MAKTDTNTISPNRRAVLTGLAAAAVVGAAVPAEAASSDLPRLIEDHRAAYRAFIEAIDLEQEVEAAYEAAHGDTIIVPSLLGGGYGMSNGYDDCKKHIAAGDENQRERLKQLSRVAPELAEQVRAVMDAKEAENMVLVDRVFAEEEARQEAFGLAAAKRNYHATSDAERDAAIAICAYPCRTLEEARLKAEYLATAPGLNDELQPEHVEALLQSFRVAA